jgi:hypothetical protein
VGRLVSGARDGRRRCSRRCPRRLHPRPLDRNGPSGSRPSTFRLEVVAYRTCDLSNVSAGAAASGLILRNRVVSRNRSKGVQPEEQEPEP